MWLMVDSTFNHQGNLATSSFPEKNVLHVDPMAVAAVKDASCTNGEEDGEVLLTDRRHHHRIQAESSGYSSDPGGPGREESSAWTCSMLLPLSLIRSRRTRTRGGVCLDLLLLFALRSSLKLHQLIHLEVKRMKTVVGPVRLAPDEEE